MCLIRWIVGQWLVINGVPNVSMIIMTYLGQNVVPIHSELSALHVHHGLGIGGENSEDEDGARMSGVALEHVNVKRDCQPDWRTWIYPLYSWLGCGFLFFFHALIMLVCSALISYKLLVTSQRKQSMLATVFVGRGSAYAAQQQRKQSSSSGRSGNGASDRRGKGQSDRRSVQIGEPGNGFQGQSDESKERERRGSPFASAASLRFTALMQEERELNEQMLSSSCKLIRDRSSSSTFDQCSTRNISGIESTKYESINEPKSKRMSLQNGESHRYLTVRQSYLTKSTSVTQSITAMTRSSPTRESPPQVAHVPVAWNRSPHVSTGAFGDSARDASREALARKGNARELRSAITVCTLAIFQAACYVPSAIICMAFCIASEYPNWIKANPTTYRHIYEV